VLIFIPLVALSAGLTQETISVGVTKQLLCDDRLIAQLNGVTRQVNPPVPVGPILVPEYPWEDRSLSYFCVMEDQGLCRMWYGCYEGAQWQRWICYATSTDGLTWSKPRVGLVAHDGSFDNNILPVDFDDGGSVFIDPLAPPQSRYKIFGIRPVPYLYESSDGVNFVLVDVPLMDRMADSHNQLFFDDRINKYVAYLRSWNFLPDYDGSLIPNRTVSRYQTHNLTDPWTYDQLDEPLYVFGPDKPPAISEELDIVMTLDSLDPPAADVYNPCVHRYTETDDAYFAFPSIYYHLPAPPEGEFHNDGTLNIQIAYSRDGLNWTRLRTPYIDTTCCGDRLQAMYMAQGMLKIGDYLYQYFHGMKETHGDPQKTSKYYCVRQRLDGFVSLDAGEHAGSVRSPKLLFGGNSLLINYVTDADGYVLVEMLDEGGAPINGFTLQDADTLRGDAVSGVVSWSGTRDIGSFRETPVRLNIVMKKAKIFSLRFPVDPLLDVSEPDQRNTLPALNQNYPNPFNPVTAIEYQVPRPMHVSMEVFNVLGQQVRTLVETKLPAGCHRAVWDGTSSNGRPLAGGVYFYRLTAGNFVSARKMLLLK
jgi:hypothetical protein